MSSLTASGSGIEPARQTRSEPRPTARTRTVHSLMSYPLELRPFSQFTITNQRFMRGNEKKKCKKFPSMVGHWNQTETVKCPYRDTQTQ